MVVVFYLDLLTLWKIWKGGGDRKRSESRIPGLVKESASQKQRKGIGLLISS